MGRRPVGCSMWGPATTRTATPPPSLANYAGTPPLTIACGKKRVVLARHVQNRRLYDAVGQWAYCALANCLVARAFYDQHRTARDRYHRALRDLSNRLVGILQAAYATTPPMADTQPGPTDNPRPLDNLRPGISSG